VPSLHQTLRDGVAKELATLLLTIKLRDFSNSFGTDGFSLAINSGLKPPIPKNFILN